MISFNILTIEFEVVALPEEAQAGWGAVSVLLRHERVADLHHPALQAAIRGTKPHTHTHTHTKRQEEPEVEFLVHFEFRRRLSALTPISESMPRLASTRVAVGIPTTDSE